MIIMGKTSLSKEEIIKRLEKPTAHSLLYFVYLYPRTQKEAVEVIYNKPSSEVSQNQIIKIRNELIETGVIEEDRKPSFNFKRIKFRSNTSIIVEHIQKLCDERKKTSHNPEIYELGESDIDLLRKLIDSNWFRSFFFDVDKIDLNNIEREYESKKLFVSNAFKLIGEVLSLISTIPYALSSRAPRISPDIRNISRYNTFEEFCKNHFEKKLNRLDRGKISSITRYLSSYPSKFIIYLTKESLDYEKCYPALCIPPNYWDVFSRIFWNTSYISEVVDAVKNYF
jgi:hypothetical protein